MSIKHTALTLGLGASILSSASAHAFDFDWDNLSPSFVENDTTNTQTFNFSDGTGSVEVTVSFSGNTGELVAPSPALFTVSGNEELRIFHDFFLATSGTVTEIAFDPAVSVQNLIIKDIDSAPPTGFLSGGFSDRIDIQGFDASNIPVSPNNVTVGTNINTISATAYESTSTVSVDYPNPVSWLTTNFDGADLVSRITITHGAGSSSSLLPSGQAITISDFTFTLPPAVSDRGDAPITYGDPEHTASGNVIYLGDIAPDFEDPTPHAAPGDDAVGDDNNDAINDEDGVTFTASTGETPNILTASIVNVSEIATHYVCAWVDLDESNTFTTEEGRCSNETEISGPLDPPVEFTWTNTGEFASYARVRISSDPLTTADFNTVVSDGEVEDYRIVYDPTAVTIGNIELQPTAVDAYLDASGIGALDNDSLHGVLEVWAPALAAQTVSDDRDANIEALSNYLDPDGDGQVALLIWETLEEQGTLGFYVERRTPGGEWQSVNERMLPSLLIAPMGGQYQLVDPAVSSGTWEYRLIEQEARGGKNTYGPYELELR
ncbi:hypothetical protein A3709_10375 [Halioglobus sp. HI00S01]|uniref:GEVED domain-containing protein n=1 Tax=Halioglobus sp. HI00S01 TaxID=1822214 RepID=UPI0007C2E172|nr:GEVED domain-containing protein [Halioglobus sp. HI00S01]KZX51227.1 hypothetical protein A3709_10375 [Halioglobus sp. HI00S01]